MEPGSRPPEAGTRDLASLDIRRLVRDHYAAVYGYAYRLAGSGADAEDLAQQTFLMAQQRLMQLREPDKAAGWLFAIARSVYWKSRRRQRPVAAAALELNVDEIPDGRIETASDIDQEQLQAALNDLTDEYKVVLVMFYFEECSYKEIAEALEIPIGTVMSRLARAKGRLRHALLTTALNGRDVSAVNRKKENRPPYSTERRSSPQVNYD